MEPIEKKVDFLEPSVQPAPPSVIDTTAMPSTTVESIKYAGFWIRFVAYMIDSLVSFVFSATITAILVFGFKVTSFEGALKYLLQLIGLIFWFFYYVFMTMKYQATLGKMAVGIIVIPEKSENLRWGQIIGREALKFISALILYIGFIMAGFTEKKQALHDKIAKTLVIYKEPNKKFGIGAKLAIILASILPILLIVGLVLGFALSGLNFVKNKAKDMQNNQDTVSVTPQQQESNSAANQDNQAVSSNQISSQQDINVFQDSILGYSISYPKDWNYTKQTDPSNGDVKISFSPNSNTIAAAVSVDKFEGVNASNPSFFPDLVSALKRDVTSLGGKISEEKDFTYKFDDGTTAMGKHFKGEFTQGNNTAKEWLVAIPTESKVYWFKYLATPDQYDSNYSLALSMLNSWKIEK
jgi:uncharacterized RDD family membrane protein YckC